MEEDELIRPTFFDASHTWLLGVRRNRCIVGRSVLRRTTPLSGKRRSRFLTNSTYGAVERSSFLLRIGSDILVVVTECSDDFVIRRQSEARVEYALKF